MPRRRLLILAAVLLFSCLAPAQALPAPQANGVVAQIRSKYVNLRATAHPSFACIVQIDWTEPFRLGHTLNTPGAQTAIEALNQTNLLFATNLVSMNTRWVGRAFPPAIQRTVDAEHAAFTQIVESSMHNVNQVLSGRVISARPRSVTAVPNGFVVDDTANADGTGVDTFDTNLVLRHQSYRGADRSLEADPGFTATPRGLVLSGGDLRLQIPPGAPEQRYVNTITYQMVSGMPFPDLLTTTLAGTGTFHLRMTNCREAQPR